MTDSSLSWLPKSAFVDGALETKFLKLVMEWTRQWMVPETRLTVELNPFSSSLSPPPLPDLCWVSANGDVCVHASAWGEETIARAMLGLAKGKGKTRAPDRDLFVQMAHTALDDLNQRIEIFIPGCSQFRTSEQVEPIKHGLEVAVATESGDHLLQVQVGTDAAIAARKVLVKKPPRSVFLGELGTAIGPQVVKFGARLGCTEISISDLDGLACGDVIVLDRAMSDALDLTINGVPVLPELATLEPTRNGVSLRLKGALNVQVG